ncbi:MAG TPA: hypothetical protein VL307_14160, partial [Chitinophagaceae bacterium]|nr:hypothetical protein [Chitinophagaceae bacterium]
MTKIYSILALLVLASTSFGQARRLVKASSSGNWDVAGTWTTTGLPATPLNNDSIVIPAGITVTVAGTNGVNFALSNSIIDIFGTLVFNTPNGTTKKNDISISTTTTAPVYVVRIASTGSIIAGSGGNGSGNLNVLVNGGTSQIKYSTAGVAGVPVGQSAGPTIVGPAFAQNTALPTNPAYFTTGSAAALPVSISLFKAALAGNSVTLNWTSLQEINSSAYIVEKSDNVTSN